MNGALVFLMMRSVRGRIVRAVKLLRQPKYLVGVVVFAAWMVFWVGSAVFRPFDDDGGSVQFANAELLFEVMGDALPALQMVVALLFALIMSLWWLVPWSRVALNLTEAEIHMLTPMPVKRRHLIQYATLKAQPGILFGSLMMTIFLGYGGPLARIGWFAAFWVSLTIWDLHAKGRALWLEKQKELPRARAWRNRLLLVGGIVVYWVVLGSALATLVGEVAAVRPAPGQELADFRATVAFLRSTLATFSDRVQAGLIGWMLAPFRWITAPLFLAAPGAGTSLRVTGVLMPLMLLVVQNEWVVRSQAKFEEAALAHARREADKKGTAARYWKTSLRSRRRVPFRLTPIGPPELGVLWKNSLIVTRFSYLNLATFGLLVIIVATAIPIAFPWFRPAPFIIISIALMTLLISPFTGSQNYRNDLRADLLRLEMVRPWPIEGWKLFAVEALSPAVFAFMSALLAAALVVSMDIFLMLNPADISDYRLTPEGMAGALGVPRLLLVPLLLLTVMPMVAALTCLATTLQNLLVLLFPGWVQLGNDKQQGAAAFGQNMIMFFGLGLASFLCLLPAALIVAIIVAVQRWIFGVPIVGWELPPLGVVAATPVFAIVALIVRAGGRVWDQLDPSKEILEGAG